MTPKNQFVFESLSQNTSCAFHRPARELKRHEFVSDDPLCRSMSMTIIEAFRKGIITIIWIFFRACIRKSGSGKTLITESGNVIWCTRWKFPLGRTESGIILSKPFGVIHFARRKWSRFEFLENFELKSFNVSSFLWGEGSIGICILVYIVTDGVRDRNHFFCNGSGRLNCILGNALVNVGYQFALEEFQKLIRNLYFFKRILVESIIFLANPIF